MTTMTILTSVTEIEDRIVEGVRDIQRPVVDYVRKSVEQAEGRLPKLTYPKVSYPKVSYPKVPYPKLNLPEVNFPELSYPRSFPLRDELAEVVETQVAFAKALFETQRSFVTELVDAVSPLVETGTTTTATATGPAVADEPVVKATPATTAKKPVTKVTRKPAAKAKATRTTRATKATKTTKA
jgi:hypothetical protein